jgi:hypothetical protein
LGVSISAEPGETFEFVASSGIDLELDGVIAWSMITIVYIDRAEL